MKENILEKGRKKNTIVTNPENTKWNLTLFFFNYKFLEKLGQPPDAPPETSWELCHAWEPKIQVEEALKAHPESEKCVVGAVGVVWRS